MLTNLLKFIITLVMTGVIPVTGIIYWGATTLKGKLCIVLTGLLLNALLTGVYSWLDRRPEERFLDWLTR